jgi:hypothetical protein
MTEKELNVRIVHLEPTRVLSTYGFGEHPEPIAWENMRAALTQMALLQDGKQHRFFGFNNPSPAPGSPNYGYEQWVTLSDGVIGDGEIAAQGATVKDFPGGLYAVTHCTLVNITQVWEQLFYWREKSAYRFGNHQWLEEALTPPVYGDQLVIDENQIELDLYMPIAE